MTLSALIAEVKTELRINDTDLDTWILSKFVEILGDYTATAFYPDLLVVNSSGTLVAATTTVALPANVQHIESVSYAVGPSPYYYYPLILFRDGMTPMMSGQSRYYRRVGTNLKIEPYDLVATTDAIRFSYYRRVVSLLTSDEFPVPSLQSPVLKKVIARVALYNEDKQVRLRDQLAGQAYAQSFGTD